MRTGELSLFLTSCSAQETGSFTFPGQHSRAGPDGGVTGELVLQLVCPVYNSVGEVEVPIIPSCLSTSGTQESWPWDYETRKAGPVPLAAVGLGGAALHLT